MTRCERSPMDFERWMGSRIHIRTEILRTPEARIDSRAEIQRK
jgi:hypothetical protein